MAFIIEAVQNRVHAVSQLEVVSCAPFDQGEACLPSVGSSISLVSLVDTRDYIGH